MVDNCFLAHEILNEVKHRKKGRRFEAILKVNLSKAYDRVRSDFLMMILKKMGLPEAWIGWIYECISTVSYSVLVNGEPSKFFIPKVGLRQGDPLSPYLFIILMESLSIKFRRLESLGKLQGIRVARRAPSISHLFFADDALFCFKATPEAIRTVKETLNAFCHLSGEVINMQKSSIIFSPNTPTRFVRILRQPLGVKSTKELGTYLGCPMDVDGRTSSKVKFLHDKVAKVIAAWKFSHLTMAGKLILINGVLIASLQHVLSIYWCPKVLSNAIMSLILIFLWTNSDSSKPIHWARKEVVCNHKSNGGLGIRSVLHLNRALLLRQGWRMANNPGLLVSRVFSGKYRADPITLGYKGRIPKSGSWPSRSIVKAAFEMRKNIGFSIGDGKDIDIRQDIWLGREKVTMREFDGCEEVKMVSDLITPQNIWSSALIWKAFAEEDARKVLSICLPSEGKKYCKIWIPDSRGRYSIKSGYWSQFEEEGAGGGVCFWGKYWKVRLWPKILLFGWKVIRNKLPTKHNLMKRGLLMEEGCVFCNKREETIEHLFRDCEVVKRAWWGEFGIRTEVNNHVQLEQWLMDLLWYSFKLEQEGMVSERILVLLYAIWLHRNEIIFRGMSVSPKSILDLTQVHARSWLRALKLREEDRLQQQSQQNFQGALVPLIFSAGTPSINSRISIIVDAAWKMKKYKDRSSWTAAVAWQTEDSSQEVQGEARKIQAQDAIQAEGYAIFWALKDNMRKYRNIVIKSDCERVIRALINPSQAPLTLRNIVDEIRLMATKIDFLVCLKVQRDLVQPAHLAAGRMRRS
ncbi:uncharacterized protein LOC110716678 [Chenopodium quinoa]|uniref:uncharacterized protein LOC110716678 n=1 Tax=Chenopodium quinoa TaxID=63459 RepID=UPI000B793528|nr:uncharacterized protein LOC110716678 [Chenopodium quinoa]